jgi:hypothetical protein
MSQTATTEQTFASGRYSKRKRTQIKYCMDELDVSDNESDFETALQTKVRRTKCHACTPSNTKQKRKPTAPKPLPKSKIFPFMDLPAEIRNIIYSYSLADPSGINLVGTFKHKRRTVERVSAAAQAGINDTSRHYSYSKINDDMRATYAEPTALVPALLAVNKQIHQEAGDMLYANDFIFADSFALYSFMLNLGPSGAKSLKSVRIMNWGYGRALKAYNHSCFAVLAWATNLNKLVLDKMPGYNRSPKGAAEQLYRDAFPWLEAIAAARGKVDAGLDALEIGEDALENMSLDRSQVGAVKDVADMFRGKLGDLLGKQQQRVMAKTVKKRKISRGVVDEL